MADSDKQLIINFIHQKKIWICVFFIDLIFILLSCGTLLKFHYASDTYAYIFDTNVIVGTLLTDGRFVSAFLYKILSLLHINASRSQGFFIAMFIICVTFLSVWLTQTISNSIEHSNWKKILLINISALLALNNVFILEWYLFPDAALMFTMALFCSVASSILIVTGKSIFRYFTSFILLFVALGSYQAVIGIFVILSCTFIMLKHSFKLDKVGIKEIAIALFIAATNCILNLIILKLLGINRGGRGSNLSIAHILNNANTIIETQKSIWKNSYGLMPNYVMAIYVIVLLIIMINLIIKRKSLLVWLAVLFILICNYISVFLPHIASANLWISHRTIVSFFFLFFSIIMIILTLKPKIKTIEILAAVTGVFLFLNMWQMQDITANTFAKDKIDYEYATLMEKQIEEYENVSHSKIKNISTTSDTNPTWTYKDVKYQIMDINVRSLIRDWADVNLINEVNHTDYKKVKMPSEIYNKYFKDKNWDYFDPSEQMVFIGNTVYISMF